MGRHMQMRPPETAGDWRGGKHPWHRVWNPGRVFVGIWLSDSLEDAWERSPKSINSWVISLSVVLSTLCVSLSFFSNIFRIRCGWQCAWGTAVMWHSLVLSPNIHIASTAGRRMLKPSYNLRCISPRMNPTIYRVHTYTWGPLVIAFARASLGQRGLVLTSMPSST